MAKNAYLVIPDLHMWNGNLANRFDYQKEIAWACERVIAIAIKYKKAGYNIVTIYGGDIYHRGYRSIEEALRDSNFFHLWGNKFGEQYVVVGNHELTYTKNNPFYSLVSEVNSTTLKSISRCIMPVKGVYPVFKVQDTLEDGEVVFTFNHYKTGVKPPIPGKINVGIFHQEICSPQIAEETKKMLKQEQGYVVSPKCQSFDVLSGYQYSFLCHMHKVVGIWGRPDGSVVAGLGSLGRTNVTEVNNDFLTRIVPVVKVEDGKITGVEAEQFDLMPYEECVNVRTLKVARDKYEVQKVAKEAKSYRPVFDDPIHDLDLYLQENEFARHVMFGVLEGTNNYDLELQKRMQEVMDRL